MLKRAFLRKRLLMLVNDAAFFASDRLPVAVAEAIESLLADAELRREMGVAGRTLAEREYAVEEVIAQHLKIYQSLCGV